MAQTRKTRTIQMVQLAILIALEALMTFTPLGFVMVPPVAITLLHIPVIIGAVLLGPLSGGILGGCFGVFSILRAVIGGNVGDLLFNPAASGNPFGSIVMAVLPRILVGVIAAWLFLLIRRWSKNDFVAIPLAAGITTALHTVMVLTLMWLFFRGTPLLEANGLRELFTSVVILNGIIEICTAVVLATAVCKPLLNLRRNHEKQE